MAPGKKNLDREIRKPLIPVLAPGLIKLKMDYWACLPGRNQVSLAAIMGYS
jgi:hypothetical protein